MKTLYCILLSLFISCSKHQNPPLGFKVQCDRNGNFRAVYSDTEVELFTLSDLKSRGAAVDRAWQQYEFEKIKHDWKDCP